MMMHKSNIICGSGLALLLTLLGVAGCSKQQAVQSPAQGNFPQDHIVRVSPQVATTKGTTDYVLLNDFKAIYCGDKQIK